ncbi:urea ABC transporter ATP-binding subunit UrtE [Pararobbsia alpina]|uniref:High-affinity branched-chain amino acid transport ATP-binding protein LivF n=1 Tax=Pararobbsia alpina TaxID=621374 RepID=A0A6S7BCB0_9BURK|nr:urea ABC transporter ATP-binding subunit UrtE [Pararobbsia alpina]CAB3793422.1 High-affinity branched-chain amino acid transport ATP-binding protein LivF [Pararobbsia alpina]
MLTISNMNVFYGQSHVIHDVSLEVRKGGAVALVGRNGMGKSTLLKSIIGMVESRNGSVALDGIELGRQPSYKRVRAGLAFVPQGRMIFPQLTVEENLLTGLETGRYGRIPDFIYDFFPGLAEMGRRKGGNLSGGQQQQLAIARALVSKPSVLILDEPTEGIQPSIIKELAKSLVALRKELGIALLVSEQVLSFALDLADRLLVIDGGRLVREADREDVDLDEVRSFLTV